jgi:hypothetical protein
MPMHHWGRYFQIHFRIQNKSDFIKLLTSRPGRNQLTSQQEGINPKGSPMHHRGGFTKGQCHSQWGSIDRRTTPRRRAYPSARRHSPKGTPMRHRGRLRKGQCHSQWGSIDRRTTPRRRAYPSARRHSPKGTPMRHRGRFQKGQCRSQWIRSIGWRSPPISMK